MDWYNLQPINRQTPSILSQLSQRTLPVHQESHKCGRKSSGNCKQHIVKTIANQAITTSSYNNSYTSTTIEQLLARCGQHNVTLANNTTSGTASCMPWHKYCSISAGTLYCCCSARSIIAAWPSPFCSEAHACRLHRDTSRAAGRHGFQVGGGKNLLIQLSETLFPLSCNRCVLLLLQGQPHHMLTLWESHCQQVIDKSAPAPSGPGHFCA